MSSLKVFFSYATKDLHIVEAIKDRIDYPSVKFYVADHEMTPGDDISDSLFREIEDCNIFLLVWSGLAEASPWVLQEVGAALAFKKPVLCIVLDAGLEPPKTIAHLKFISLIERADEEFLAVTAQMRVLFDSHRPSCVIDEDITEDDDRSRPKGSVCDRFIDLFEHHDIHRNQIPRFFGHGLTLKDVQSNEGLIEKLDHSLIDAACQLFGVRCEWLEGVESQIYPHHDFYKNPSGVLPFLKSLKASSKNGDLSGVLMVSEDKSGDAVVVLSESIGSIGEKMIYRYHLCNNWVFDYWKSRAYLTAFVAIAWNIGVHVRGVILPKETVDRVAWGNAFLSGKNSRSIDAGGMLWYPEDMALRPEDFLSGVDPERNQFGLISALEVWLNLEKNGYMKTGLSMYKKEEIRYLFEQALLDVNSNNDLLKS